MADERFDPLKETTREAVAALNPEALGLLEKIEQALAQLLELTKEKGNPERVAGAGFAVGLALYVVQTTSQSYTEAVFKDLGAAPQKPQEE